ncbi:MAG: hypothetical protein M3Z30_07185 [Gemmatimonadota bacterium]|nr:hypothetical protein [Gemmatimonadota bacterium]
MSDFRPRSSSELLDAAFEIYRRHFLVLMAISVFAAIPDAAASYVSEGAILTQSTGGLMNGLLVRLAGLLISPFTTGAVAVTTSIAYLGGTVDLGNVLRVVFARPVRLFFATLTVAFLVGFGLVLFIVPGFIAYKRYFAVLMVVLFEDRSIGKAMSRSRELADGNGTRIFGLIGAVFLFAILVSMFLAGGLTAVTHGAPRVIGRMIIIMVVNPFATIVATLLYYDIRIRKEGYDIELMAEALAPSPLVPQPSA